MTAGYRAGGAGRSPDPLAQVEALCVEVLVDMLLLVLTVDLIMEAVSEARQR